MKLYLSFEEYTDLSGLITDESIYNKVARKSQHFLDYITFNRIPLLPAIPEVVKDAMCEFVDATYRSLYSGSGEDITPTDANVSSYSNSVEKITYKISSDADKEKELNKLMTDLAYKYLPDYLLARGVNFDVEQYLQSDLQSKNNNP